MADERENKRKDGESPDENIYDEGDRQDQLDDDEISPAEAGFVEGYQDVKEGVCNSCGKEIDPETVVEKEVGGKVLTFCCQRCADHFEKRKAGLR